MANLMPEVAKLLGVEIGEKFIIENIEHNLQVVLAADGLHISTGDFFGRPNGNLLQKVLCGLFEVKKLQWEPKFGEPYWTISFSTNFTVRVIKKAWEKDCVDFALLRLGMVYRTMQEATDHMAEDYEKLTGRKLEG